MSIEPAFADRRALARALSAVENRTQEGVALWKRIAAKQRAAGRIGITGPPGVGKSTLATALIRWWRAQGRTVAVVAVDPSSPRTGGALLGDRVRMGEHGTDPGVYVRSLASRGEQGGLSAAAGEVMDVLDSAGFDRILLETVGVGQADIEVMTEAEVVLLVLGPGAGDTIQTLKSGIIDIADVFAVNKADLPEAARVHADLLQSLGLAEGDHGQERHVHLVSASQGDAVGKLAEDIESKLGAAAGPEERSGRRRSTLKSRILHAAHRLLDASVPALDLDCAVDRMLEGGLDAAEAARLVLQSAARSEVRCP